MFIVGAELASDAKGAARLTRVIEAEDISELEQLIDQNMTITGPLKAFVIFGKTRLQHNCMSPVR